jgi:hypothetical protein
MVFSMPNKEKLKNPSANPRKKVKYKVENWTDYNKSLRKRGTLTGSIKIPAKSAI